MEVLQSVYLYYKIDQNRTIANLKLQFIFYNKYLKIENRLICNEEMFRAGLWKVCDLFHSDNTAIQFNVWKQRGVSKANFMTWRSLLSKVRSYRGSMCGLGEYHCSHIRLPTEVVVNIETGSCKDVYKNVVMLKREDSKAIQRYIDIFPLLEEADIETVHCT